MSGAREAEARRLVAALVRQGVRFEARGGALSVAAPDGTMTDERAAEIRRLKPEILALTAARAVIPPAERNGPLPLGLVQERMWAHAQMEPDALIYNLPAAWRLSGRFDEAAFSRAFDAFAARHEVLRTRIVLRDGVPAQTFATRAGALTIEDLSATGDADERERRLAGRIEALRLSRFDLERGDPFIARLIRLSGDERVLFFMPHHLVWDGWCFDLFLSELSELYAADIGGRESRLRAPMQYTDYALWHRREAELGRWAPDIEHWEKTLGPLPEPPNLPADLPRPRLFDPAGDWLEFDLGAAGLARLASLANAHRATTFMAFLAIWRAFLARISGETDIIVAAPVQARQHADAGEAIGCFVNTIFLRQAIDLDGSLGAAIGEARALCVAAYAHQEAPVELLVDRLVPHRDPSRTPLAQVMFSHQQVSLRPTAFAEAALTQLHVNPRTTPTDLMLAVMEGRDSARVILHYATSLYSRAQIASLKDAFERFLGACLDQPQAPLRTLPLLVAGERTRLLVDLNATETPFAHDRFADDLIADAAARWPGRTAIRFGGEAISCAALQVRANRLAGLLASRGVGRGDIVGVMMPRTPDMVALALGIWRCGAAYLPLDPSLPAERLAFMIGDSGARLVVSTRAISAIAGAAARLDLDDVADEISESSERVPTPGRDPSDRAYVIYTSGSTGRPKGVENSHRALANFLNAMAAAPFLDQGDRVLAMTTLAFDISILELFAPLVVGAEIALVGGDEAADGERLAAIMREAGVTLAQATPATWRLLIESGWQGDGRLKALSGGEALTPALAGALLPRVGALWNMYGPTETTVWSTYTRIAAADHVTIGAPIANTRLYIVDERGEPLPVGVPGELWIGGEGVAPGYLNREDLTAARFACDPFRNDRARIYKTGDLARRRHDDAIELIGRIDAQVKLRGFRIELGEIEAALEALGPVARAVAALKPDAAGEPTLVAYIQYKDGHAATGSELRRALRRTLPGYMLPQMFMELKALPLTATGKIDRRRLPDPDAGARERRGARIGPRSPLEQAIAEVWRQTLSTTDISITDNFFELGGQSLQAAQMAARVRERTGVRLSPRAVIFETLEQLAAGENAP